MEAVMTKRQGDRRVLSIAVSQAAHNTLKKIKHEQGINQVEVVSRLVEWFHNQANREQLKILAWAAEQRRVVDVDGAK